MFYRNQRVVCVNDEGTPQLRKGAIYTVKQVFPVCLRRWVTYNLKAPMGALSVYEAEPAPSCEGFYLGRFRPAVDRPTDISIFTKMLTKKGIKKHAHQRA